MPGIRDCPAPYLETWMAGTSPAMTQEGTIIVMCGAALAVGALIPGTYISRWAPCVRAQGPGRDSSRQDRKAPGKCLLRTPQPRLVNVVRPRRRRTPLISRLPLAPPFPRVGEGGGEEDFRARSRVTGRDGPSPASLRSRPLPGNGRGEWRSRRGRYRNKVFELVIARSAATKQSRIGGTKAGLLRFARNDDFDEPQAHKAREIFPCPPS